MIGASELGGEPATAPKEPVAPAPSTEGLNALDRERAGSLADEGGASGAALESQERCVGGRPWRPRAGWLVAALGLVLATAWRLARRR